MSTRVVRIRLRGWILIAALLFGVPVLAQGPSQGRSQRPRLLLIPLDDRPSSVDFPVRIGAIAGATVVTPPRELLGRFTQPADADAVQRWVRATLTLTSRGTARPRDAAPVDAVIVSVDLLTYGGLVASRTLESGSVEQALARLQLLREIRARYPRLPLYASASLMRLAPTADGQNEAYREALARWAEIAPDSMRPAEAEELVRLRARIPDAILTAYRAARARNVRVHEALLELSADGVLTHLVFTQDDARARGVHLGERDRLTAQVARRGLQDRISIQAGTDEFGMLLVARALTALRGRSPMVAVQYVAPSDSARVMPFEDRPLAETVRTHLRLAGARIADARITRGSDESALQLVVHTVRATGRGAASSPDGSARAAALVRANPLPVILADIDPTGAIQGADTTLTDYLSSSRTFATLAGYGGWNTAGNAVGTAVAHGVVRWLVAGDSSAAPSTAQQTAHAAFLLDRWLDDDLYKSRIRPALVASIRARGWDPFRLTAVQTVTIEEELRAAVRQRVAMTTDLSGVIGTPCRLTSPIDVRLPWGRTFEAAFDFALRCD